MAKSVNLEILSGVGSSPETLNGLVPDNPLVANVGSAVASLLTLRADPVSVVVRYPSSGSGELRRIYLVDETEEGYGAIITAITEEDDVAVLAELLAENTPLTAKAYGMADVTQTATLAGTALAGVGTELRAIQDSVLLPSVPRLSLAQMLNKLDDILLVNNDEPHVVALSQYSSSVHVMKGVGLTQTFVQGELTNLVAGLAMENYVPPSSSIDRHFFESGAVL